MARNINDVNTAVIRATVKIQLTEALTITPSRSSAINFRVCVGVTYVAAFNLQPVTPIRASNPSRSRIGRLVSAASTLRNR